MSYAKRLALLAAVAVVGGAGAGAARGADPYAPGATTAPTASSSTQFRLENDYTHVLTDASFAEPASTAGLLHTNMRERGWGGSTLEEYGIFVGGHVNAGYTYNFKDPPGGFNGRGRLFDDKSEDPSLNQISLFITRPLVPRGDRADSGFMFEVMYGSDARFTQANGTNFYGSGYAGKQDPSFVPNFPPGPGERDVFVDEINFPGQPDPNEQIDILQAYGMFNLPMGNGLVLRAGKFVTPWGMEHVNPTQNLFYSHSYIFGLSRPQTLTGLTATYALNDEWALTGGIVVGWDQALKDNNDFPSFVGQAEWRVAEDTTIVFSGLVGPEQEDDSGDLRMLADVTVQWQVDQYWRVGLEGVAGYESDAGYEFFDLNVGSDVFPQLVRTIRYTGDDALWFGGAAYSSYKLDDDGIWTLNMRGEYFNDSYGARLLLTEVYAATFGLSIVPFVNHEIGRNFIIRPEFRYDWAQDDIFDGSTKNNQMTLSADLIFKF